MTQEADRATPIVDALFDVRGRSLPADHGYPLYAALCNASKALHGARWLFVHPILGRIGPDERLRLSAHAALVLRLPVDRFPDIVPLMERELRIGDDHILLGTPRVRPLRPSNRLDSRLVVVRLTKAPRRSDGSIDKEAFRQAFRAELDRQLGQLEINATYELGLLREVAVARQRVIGYGVQFEGLSDEDSLKLQAKGLGGKHRMGCGVFIPSR